MLPIVPTSERADLQHLTAQARRANTPQLRRFQEAAANTRVLRPKAGPWLSHGASGAHKPALWELLLILLQRPSLASSCSFRSDATPVCFLLLLSQLQAADCQGLSGPPDLKAPLLHTDPLLTTFSGVRPVPCLQHSFILHSFIFLAKQPFSFSGDENRGYKRWLSAQTQIPSGHDLSSSSTHSAFKAHVGRLPQAGGCSSDRPRYSLGLPARESPGTPETWKQPLGTRKSSEGPAGRLKQLLQAGHTAWALMSTHLFPTVSPWGVEKIELSAGHQPWASHIPHGSVNPGLSQNHSTTPPALPAGPPRARCRKHWGPSRKPAVFPYK